MENVQMVVDDFYQQIVSEGISYVTAGTFDGDAELKNLLQANGINCSANDFYQLKRDQGLEGIDMPYGDDNLITGLSIEFASNTTGTLFLQLAPHRVLLNWFDHLVEDVSKQDYLLCIDSGDEAPMKAAIDLSTKSIGFLYVQSGLYFPKYELVLRDWDNLNEYFLFTDKSILQDDDELPLIPMKHIVRVTTEGCSQ
ncbi:hypothetical protein [Limosilactobacillus ingluviei]|uniref:Uncharacterized protein n=1 Tax=Limosilactobacillus ingluviei TaxID=148604 RepID=A0A0R2GU38_9LACO|nr:hypothetical protein [Limosilactobacillus ingluviei]KRN43579.1 hypothetical protein IV41_GL001657 [Limosilactobacillus ingluviei]